MGWDVKASDLEDLAIGCALLGTGGGGDVGFSALALRQVLKRGAVPRVIDVEELPDDALVVCAAYIGAPIVGQEKLIAEAEITSAFPVLEKYIGRRINAVVAVEIGGANGLVPLLASALTGIPVVDADSMGRAYPQGNMTTFSIYGMKAAPAVVASPRGEVSVVEALDNLRVEEMQRALCTVLGSSAFVLDYPMDAAQLRQWAVPRTLSLAREMGRAVRSARERGADVVAELNRTLGGRDGGKGTVAALFEGSVSDVRMDTGGGFSTGRLLLKGINGRVLQLDFKNEFLVAWIDGRPIAATPDLLTLVDTDTWNCVGTDTVRYGVRVTLLRLPAPGLMTTPQALSVVGPRGFGYDFDWPVGAA